jgi:hypothetical protein
MVLIGTASAAPYAVTWTPPADGPYLLYAIADSGQGKSTTSPAVHVFVSATPGKGVVVTFDELPNRVVQGLFSTGGNATGVIANAQGNRAFQYTYPGAYGDGVFDFGFTTQPNSSPNVLCVYQKQVAVHAGNYVSVCNGTTTTGTVTLLKPRPIGGFDLYNSRTSPATAAAECLSPTGAVLSSGSWTVPGGPSGSGGGISVLTGWSADCKQLRVSFSGTWAMGIDNIGLGAILAPPTVLSTSVSNVSPTSATFGAQVDSHGSSTTGWFVYGTSNGACAAMPNTTPSTGNLSGSAAAFSQSVAGLSSATTYYVCAAARNVAGTTFGAVQSFTTAPAQSPSGTGTTTVDFNTVPGAAINRAFSGQYPVGVIDWGTAAGWFWSSRYAGLTTNNWGFASPSVSTATFSFMAPIKLLVSIQASNGGRVESTVTISCAGQTPRQASVPFDRSVVTIATGWTSACSPVTISSSNGWNTNLDNLVYQ